MNDNRYILGQSEIMELLQGMADNLPPLEARVALVGGAVMVLLGHRMKTRDVDIVPQNTAVDGHPDVNTAALTAADKANKDFAAAHKMPWGSDPINSDAHTYGAVADTIVPDDSKTLIFKGKGGGTLQVTMPTKETMLAMAIFGYGRPMNDHGIGDIDTLLSINGMAEQSDEDLLTNIGFLMVKHFDYSRKAGGALRLMASRMGIAHGAISDMKHTVGQITATRPAELLALIAERRHI